MDTQQSGIGYHVILRGLVQGVGFRPFVYREAVKYGLRGTVRNHAGDVEIWVAGEGPDRMVFADFLESVRRNAPPGSHIESVTVTPAAVEAAEFMIEESGNGPEGTRLCPPDIALCAHCRAEVFSADNRRAGHWFNNCTACGPRFSVLNAFPYDRANTTMGAFPMCGACALEYNAPDDPRFHAETICCPQCGPVLRYRRGDAWFEGEEAFQEALKDLPDGIAVKGVGGYHLACSPYGAEGARNLRRLKARETKPFALMFRDVDAIAQVCDVTPAEEELLRSAARPIVLLKRKNNPFAPEVLRNADGRCGCFLPYTPLQELMLAEMPCLVMTSANLSSAPLITEEQDIFALTDRVLYYNREITRGVEDSVAQMVADKPQLIRRGRGYVPLPVGMENPENHALLALGGDIKASFGLCRGQALILSQPFGDLENEAAFQQYAKGMEDLEGLFSVQPEAVVCDAHPRYFSSGLGAKLARERNIPLIPVFHHHAHIASVMAEHKLSRVLGVAMDGSGYGGDGNVWGGEFLLCEGEQCRRAGHLAYTKLLGADEAAKNAAQTAACYLYAHGIPLDHPDREVIQAALEHNINTFQTSSMGRLFDAAAALLGVCQANSYEGECATRLQYRAEEEERAGIAPVSMRFSADGKNGMRVFGCQDILEKCRAGGPGAALGFHHAVCDMVTEMCLWARQEEGVQNIALSGGVFQNVFLLENITARLTALGFHVYINERVPPNDGGLALGQAYIGIRRLRNVHSGTDGTDSR